MDHEGTVFWRRKLLTKISQVFISNPWPIHRQIKLSIIFLCLIGMYFLGAFLLNYGRNEKTTLEER